MATQQSVQIGPLIITGTQIGPLLDVRVRTATESAGMSMSLAEWSQLCGVVTVLEASGKEIERLQSENEQLRDDAKTWSCPDCAFTFCAYHTNEDGSLTCPLCELMAANRELESARAAWNIWQAETERLREERREATRQLSALEQENERMRPVVEAAMAYRRALDRDDDHDDCGVFMEAIDAATKETP